LKLDALIRFFQELTIESLDRLGDFYADGARFKDPFNDVRGVDAIRRIFVDMFERVAQPRFVITDQIADANSAMLVWEFHCRVRLLGREKTQVIRGASHLKFDANGKVEHHRDYWDAAEELYMKLPALGLLMRWLRNALKARD
jgi:steroid delta-isomerase